eukprot:Sspe_Gene.20980::Locus_7787_Transcript_2_2_Confidence_0.750_Length_1519::g.20980::m.20980
MHRPNAIAATNRVLLLALGASLMLNLWLVLHIPGQQCSEITHRQDVQYQATTKMLTSIKGDIRDLGSQSVSRVSTSAKECPPCKPCPECVCEGNQATKGDEEQETEQDVSASRGGAPAWVWMPDREHWDFRVTKPKGYKTANTVYDPAQDAKLQKLLPGDKNRYALSPVPMGSARVRVAPDKWITLDEFAFAHDVFFEEWQRFSFGNWLGVICQQDPMDAFAIQDMLWRVKPDLIIEVGTNNGGGAVFYASIMSFYNPKGKVLTLDLKPVNQSWMSGPNKDNCQGCITGDKHPLWTDSGIIEFIKGDITTRPIQEKVEEYVKKAKTVLVVEDASHRYPDTLRRMEVIYKYVTPGSYMLVQDTKMDRFVSRLRKKYGGLKFGPMRSVDEFIREHKGWQIDRSFEYYIYSQHHRGFLKRLE